MERVIVTVPMSNLTVIVHMIVEVLFLCKCFAQQNSEQPQPPATEESQMSSFNDVVTVDTTGILSTVNLSQSYAPTATVVDYVNSSVI